jgi:hypothetical protein
MPFVQPPLIQQRTTGRPNIPMPIYPLLNLFLTHLIAVDLHTRMSRHAYPASTAILMHDNNKDLQPLGRLPDRQLCNLYPFRVVDERAMPATVLITVACIIRVGFQRPCSSLRPSASGLRQCQVTADAVTWSSRISRCQDSRIHHTQWDRMRMGNFSRAGRLAIYIILAGQRTAPMCIFRPPNFRWVIQRSPLLPGYLGMQIRLAIITMSILPLRSTQGNHRKPIRTIHKQYRIARTGRA